MKRVTIKDKVLSILREEGQIDNYWAIDNRLTTRLSDTIFQLVQDGKIELDESKSGYFEGTKNWNYVIKPLEKKNYYVNGVLVASTFI